MRKRNANSPNGLARYLLPIFYYVFGGSSSHQKHVKDSDCRQCREMTRGPFPFPFGRLELLQNRGDGGHCFLFFDFNRVSVPRQRSIHGTCQSLYEPRNNNFWFWARESITITEAVPEAVCGGELIVEPPLPPPRTRTFVKKRGKKWNFFANQSHSPVFQLAVQRS
ncbi:hypothetical protein CDAR_539171 [Caerostris darwini]|uniref:Uncharacterized protein n=1 Tax=Caerostris darwini TaxID=1538125 RepID=A0AAV4T1H6_9ARAC|nr:hypothetical protein CDAR_539171 [Caerostris darwini]